MIDDKLWEIVRGVWYDGAYEYDPLSNDERTLIAPDDAVLLIKQAFIDEGWQQPTSSKAAFGRYKNGVYQGDLITGKQFYDRFNKEVELLTKHIPDQVKKMKDWNLNSKALAAIIGYDLDKAAQRAAGLDEKN